MGLFRRRGPEPRPPVADLTTDVEVGGEPWPLASVEVGARVDGGRLSVELHHPGFADPRFTDPAALLSVAHELLVAILGDKGARQVVHRLSAVAYPPIDAFGPESLRAFARSLGADVDPPGP